MATMCIKYADKRAIFRHILEFANASTKYFHSGYLVTEFNTIYSKIPILHYIKRCNVEIMLCVDDVTLRPYGCV